MAIQSVCGGTLMRRCSGATEVFQVLVFRSRSSQAQCSVLASAAHKKASSSVTSPVSRLSLYNYSSYFPSNSSKNYCFQSESQFHPMVNKTSSVTDVRYGPSLQSIPSVSTHGKSVELNRINFNRSTLSTRKQKFGALSCQLSSESPISILSWVVAGRLALPGGMAPSIRHVSGSKSGISNIHNRITSLQAKKRTQRKKKQPQADSEEEWQVTAYATADEYDLEKLLEGLIQQGLYTTPDRLSSQHGLQSTSSGSDSGGSVQASTNLGSNSVPSLVPDAHDVLHVVAAYQLESEQREIYFFREGSVVFWNVAELERLNVLRFLKKYEEGKHEEQVVEEESESLTYKYNDGPSKTRLVRDKIFLNPEGQTNLEKYTFSNALTMSVKLGIWEASLDKYIDNIEYVSEELSKTGKVVLSQDQVLQRMGQLFALRHLINLSSDLLDVPDFYWEHEELEQLYKKVSNHLNVSKRTSVMNIKLGHCVELMELLKSHLSEQHSSRLEWIIIILIMVEVGFELLHFLERLF